MSEERKSDSIYPKLPLRNIETPLPTMVKAFKQAMAESGGMGGGDITVQAVLDGRIIYEQTVKQNNIELRRTGINRLAY